MKIDIIGYAIPDRYIYMNQRQIDLLGVILKEYIGSGVPVASESLVEKYELPFSSATIRNEMMKLEEEGFLCQPHTSAGRIPSDKGYRFYVDYLMKLRELGKREEEKLKKQIQESQESNERLIHNLARAVADLSNTLVIVGMVEDRDFYEEAGVRNFLDQYEPDDALEMQQIIFDLEYIDKNAWEFTRLLHDDIGVYIGTENPMRPIQKYSTIVSSYELPNREQGFLALLGPKRMDYEKNISLVDCIIKYLET